jgi:hypothetical protein
MEGLNAFQLKSISIKNLDSEMKERRIFNECSVKLAFTKPSLDKQEDVLIV